MSVTFYFKNNDRPYEERDITMFSSKLKLGGDSPWSDKQHYILIKNENIMKNFISCIQNNLMPTINYKLTIDKDFNHIYTLCCSSYDDQKNARDFYGYLIKYLTVELVDDVEKLKLFIEEYKIKYSYYSLKGEKKE